MGFWALGQRREALLIELMLEKGFPQAFRSNNFRVMIVQGVKMVLTFDPGMPSKIRE